MVFYRGLAALISAGVVIPRALEIMASQCEHRELRRALDGCQRSLQKGRSLSRGMRLYSVFSPLQVSLVAMGEETGRLPQVLERLANAAEKDNAVSQRVKAALIYPLMIAAVSLLFVVLVPALTFPGLASFFQGLGVAMPWETRMLLAFLRLVASWPLWLGLGLLWLAGPWRHPRVWFRLELLLDRLPGVGQLRQVAGMAEVARSLAVMYAAGVPILQALDLAADSSGTRLSLALRQVKQSIADGASLHQALAETRQFPPVFTQLVAAGEECGQVAPMMQSAAKLADEMVDEGLAVIVGSLQPLILAAVGFWVGLLVLAMIAPMIEVAQRL